MKLNLILPTKVITFNNKEVKIPKLGLKHHKIVKDIRTGDENIRLLIRSIHDGLDGAESEFVLVHLAAFNGRCKEKKVVDGFEYNINTLKIVRELSFEFKDTFEFRSPQFGETFTSAKNILESTKTVDVDFGNMPAFVGQWAEKIVSTITMDGPYGPIEGCAQILGILE